MVFCYFLNFISITKIDFLVLVKNNGNGLHSSPFPGVVLGEDGDHSLHGAQDGAVNDHGSVLVLTVSPAAVQTVKL